MQERPRGNKVERTPKQEQERLNIVNPVSARMLFGSIKPYYLEPKPWSVSAEDKAKVSAIKRESLNPIFNAIGAASVESRNKSSKPLSNRQWNESMQNFVRDMVDESVPDELREERLRALAALDIKPKQAEKNNRGLQTDIENFRQKYVDYGKADIDKFVAIISQDLRNENGVVSLAALEKRLIAIEPLLGVFGEDTNIGDLIMNVTRTASLISQPEQIRQRVVSIAADSLNSPAVDEDQQSLELLSRHAAEARPHPILQKAVLIDLRDVLERKRNETIKLTPELAQNDPERFKKVLYQKLENSYPLAYQAWQLVQQGGRALPENITLYPNEVNCHNTVEGEIQLGVSDRPYDTLPFEHEKFTYEKEIMYRFVHEITHDFVDKLLEDQAVNSLKGEFVNVRMQQGIGVSNVANHIEYEKHGPGYQGKEDMVELTNMFLQDPQYFKRYLVFLADPNQEQSRSDMKVITINMESASNIYQIIGGAALKVLQTELPKTVGPLSEHISQSPQEQPVYQAA